MPSCIHHCQPRAAPNKSLATWIVALANTVLSPSSIIAFFSGKAQALLPQINFGYAVSIYVEVVDFEWFVVHSVRPEKKDLSHLLCIQLSLTHFHSTQPKPFLWNRYLLVTSSYRLFLCFYTYLFSLAQSK